MVQPQWTMHGLKHSAPTGPIPVRVSPPLWGAGQSHGLWPWLISGRRDQKRFINALFRTGVVNISARDGTYYSHGAGSRFENRRKQHALYFFPLPHGHGEFRILRCFGRLGEFDVNDAVAVVRVGG